MRHIVPVACLLAVAAPAAARQVQPPPPPPSSPTLAAVAPVLAATPGLTLVGYPVAGRSPRGIRASMNQARPEHDGRTQFRYNSRWRRTSGGECDPASAQVEVAFVVTLPDLTTRDQLNRRERERWDRYFSALVTHEHNHVRITLQGMNRLRTMLAAATSCEAMQAARERIGAEVDAAQKEYDRVTNHGRTEGAVYP